MTSQVKIAIVGGGWTGVMLAQKLEAKKSVAALFDITIYDQKKQMFNNIPGLQACVEPDLTVGMLVPKANMLKYGRIVHAEVEAVLPIDAAANRRKPAVKLRARTEPAEFDLVVCCTGTQYNFPGKVPWWIGVQACQKLYQQIRTSIDSAENIVIVGGGPVGCELSCAITGEFPQKSVTLIHSGSTLCSSVRGPALDGSGDGTRTSSGLPVRQKVLQKLNATVRRLGTTLALNERVILDENLMKIDANQKIQGTMQKAADKARAASTAEEADACGATPTASDFIVARGQSAAAAAAGEGQENDLRKSFMLGQAEGISQVKTESGKTFPADLVFLCTGPKSNDEVYRESFLTDYRGRIRVTDQLVARRNNDDTSFPGVLAIGDCCGTRFDDEQNLVAGEGHIDTAAKNLIALAKQGYGAALTAYKPDKRAVMLVYLGRRAMLGDYMGLTIGTWLGNKLKNPELISRVAWKMAGCGKPPKSNYEKMKAKKGCCGGGSGVKSAAVTSAAYEYKDEVDDDW